MPEIFDYLGRAIPNIDDPLFVDHPTGSVFEPDSYNIISEKAFVVSVRLASMDLPQATKSPYPRQSRNNNALLS